MPPTERWTVGRLLQWTVDYLQRCGSESPRLDAEVLLAEAMGCERIRLYTAFEEEPDEPVKGAFRELVRKRAQGVPVAYLVGRREFYSLSFRVTSDVLIPRPETEFLVVTLLDLARPRPASEAVDVCDVGTGSGALAVCIARHLPSARVLALDVSRAALDVAAENVGEHGVAERVELLQSDLFADVAPQRTFDFIVSNPPYVSEAEYGRLAPEVREHEPRGALVAGRQGTEVIARLVAEAADRLNAEGSLLIEVSPMIHEAAVELIQAEPRLEVGPTVKDLGRQPRVVQAKKA